jgi:hypothetical protein
VEQGEVEIMVRQVLRIQVAEAAQITMQAVQASSSFAIQTHSEPQQAQQVHQRLLWLEALGSTNSQPMVLLRFNHGNN